MQSNKEEATMDLLLDFGTGNHNRQCIPGTADQIAAHMLEITDLLNYRNTVSRDPKPEQETRPYGRYD